MAATTASFAGPTDFVYAVAVPRATKAMAAAGGEDGIFRVWNGKQCRAGTVQVRGSEATGRKRPGQYEMTRLRARTVASLEFCKGLLLTRFFIGTPIRGESPHPLKMTIAVRCFSASGGLDGRLVLQSRSLSF